MAPLFLVSKELRQALPSLPPSGMDIPAPHKGGQGTTATTTYRKETPSNNLEIPTPARHTTQPGRGSFRIYALPLWNPCSIVCSKYPTVFRSNAYSPQAPRAAILSVSPNFGHGMIPRQSHDTKN